MKKLFLTAIIFDMLILLSGCQQFNKERAKYIRDRDKDYYASTVIAPLRVPDDLNQPAGAESYPLPPNLPPSGSVAKVSLVPPGFGQLSQVD